MPNGYPFATRSIETIDILAATVGATPVAATRSGDAGVASMVARWRGAPAGVAATVVAAVVLVALAACVGGQSRQGSATATGAPSSASPTASPTPSVAAAGASCPSPAARGTQVRFPDGKGATIAGVMVGVGGTGIVLAHQSAGTLCQWLPYGIQLAGRGYRVLAFDFAGFGASTRGVNVPLATDVAAAAGYLRSQGATRVILIGASMGGAGCVAAAAQIQPPVAGVIGLSAPARFADTDAVAGARQLKVPVLYAIGERDTDFVADVQALYDATPTATPRTLLRVDTGLHGVSLVTIPQVQAALDRFLSTYGPAK
jgi:pimeloyl-ACP methyl ester carboxylesterase